MRPHITSSPFMHRARGRQGQRDRRTETAISTFVPVGTLLLHENSVVSFIIILFDFNGDTHAQSLSRVQLSATPWTVACQAPLSMGFRRQEYWSGLPFPTSGNLSNPGIELVSPVSSTVGRFFTTASPGKPFMEV